MHTLFTWIYSVSMRTEGLLSFPHTHQPLCKFKLCSWTFWIIRIFTACFIFTQDPSESLDPPLSTFSSFLNPFLVTLALSPHAWTQNYDPGTGSQAVLILSAIIWQKETPKTQTLILLNYCNSSASCSDWQVRAPIRYQFNMATHP